MEEDYLVTHEEIILNLVSKVAQLEQLVQKLGYDIIELRLQKELE